MSHASINIKRVNISIIYFTDIDQSELLLVR